MPDASLRMDQSCLDGSLWLRGPGKDPTGPVASVAYPGVRVGPAARPAACRSGLVDRAPPPTKTGDDPTTTAAPPCTEGGSAAREAAEA